MNYPTNTIVQSFNVTAARLIQLPCFDDQQEPPDGFRAMVFQFSFQTGSLFQNQSGPIFTGNNSAVNFDLSSVIGNGSAVGMSKVRSVVLSMFPNINARSATPLVSSLLLFNSGAQFPVSGQSIAGVNLANEAQPMPSIFACDFLSAIPELGVWVPVADGSINTLMVANFKMNAQLTTAGLNVPGGG